MGKEACLILEERKGIDGEKNLAFPEIKIGCIF